MDVYFPEPTPPPLSIRLEKSQYTVSESDPFVRVCVLVQGSGKVHATLVSLDQTAIAGKGIHQYVIQHVTLPFSPQITKGQSYIYPKKNGNHVWTLILLMTN